MAPRTYSQLLQPALERVQARDLGEEVTQELQSILTGLKNLPDRLETEPEKLTERVREKEIIKKRLARCCETTPELTSIIWESIHAIEGTVGDPRSFDIFDTLLSSQAYRLSYWRVAAEEINHRRFFDINELAAIRVELPEVFEATHRLVLDLIRTGAVTGLRIDHVDGLWYPRGYLEQLQQRMAEIKGVDAAVKPLYLVVEKILLGEERLPADWPVHGTTGYDYIVEATGLYVDPAARKSFTDTYAKFLNAAPNYEEIIYQKKLLTMRISLVSEINMLGRMLSRLAEKNRWYRDFTLNALTSAVRVVMACFPVYRTYLAPGGELQDNDREAVLRAVRLAKRRNPAIERSVFNFLGEILLGKFPENISEADREEHMRFVLKFQQCTGPVMAKGVEDTAFYQYNRLMALNEVGSEPQQFGTAPDLFFDRCSRRLGGHPHAMLASTTHDTKRSEDTRLRIAALSEFPAEWRTALSKWRTINRSAKKMVEGEAAPDANEEYLLYQTLLGTWPTAPMSEEEQQTYVKRIQEYMIKAIKEAKINSSWIQPNDDWESAVRQFVERILKPGNNRFLREFEPLARQIAPLGMVNSLSQLVLKCTTPGLPDFYQGTELWDLSLVDPDNRRAVDYEARRELLSALDSAEPAALFQSWEDGRIKLLISRQLLKLRAERPSLFQEGDFEPLKVHGAYAESCLAFRRRAGEGRGNLVVIVPRLTRRLHAPPIGEAWGDTVVTLAHGEADESAAHPEAMKNIFTGRPLPWQNGQISVAEALQDLPVAVFA